MLVFGFDPCSPRLALACRRLAAAYARQPGADVPIVEAGGYRRAFSTEELLKDFDKMLDHAVAWANVMGSTDNDWPPFVDTYVGVCMVAEAFGCEIAFTPGADPWTRPAITDISQVWGLKPKKVGESYMIRQLTGWIDTAQRKLGADVPIWTMDVQSPFSVACHVMDASELMMACLTDPPAVHHLCQMITDFSIAMMQAHIAQMEHPGFPGRNFPSVSDNIGICLADDTPLIMLGPDLYREFALPYNSQIGEAFGGLHIHSCGDYRHNLDNLLLIRNIRSIQLHAGPGEFPLPETAEEDCPFNRARKVVTCFVDNGSIARGDLYRNRPKDHYADYVLPRLMKSDPAGLILQSCSPGQDLPDVQASLRWTRESVIR